jgi:hypothetical protein
MKQLVLLIATIFVVVTTAFAATPTDTATYLSGVETVAGDSNTVIISAQAFEVWKEMSKKINEGVPEEVVTNNLLFAKADLWRQAKKLKGIKNLQPNGDRSLIVEYFQ